MPIALGISEDGFMPDEIEIINDGEFSVARDHSELGRLLVISCISDNDGGELTILPLEAKIVASEDGIVFDESDVIKKLVLRPNRTRDIGITVDGMEPERLWLRHGTQSELPKSDKSVESRHTHIAGLIERT